jgi:hypothetical protein
MGLADRMKLRLGIAGAEQDALIDDILESASAVYLSAKYPFTNAPAVLDRIADDWILRAGIEMYAKIGAEGQLSHSENGISRSYESALVSKTLMREITPVTAIQRSG